MYTRTRLSFVLCRVGLGIGMLFLGACASTGSSARSDDEASGEGVGDPMPNLVVEEFWKKDEITLSSLRGKVVLLDIWASWCAPCKEEMPMLDAMASRLRSKGVEILAVSIDEERGNAEEFLKSKPHWALTVAHDPTGKVPDRLKPPKMPTSYVVDRKGILRRINAGFEPADIARLEKELSRLASK